MAGSALKTPSTVQVGQVYQHIRNPLIRVRVEKVDKYGTAFCFILNKDGSLRKSGRGGTAETMFSTGTLERAFRMQPEVPA